MSNPSASPESTSSFVATLLAAIGGFAIFLLILLVAYHPNKVSAPGDGVKTPAERKAALAELRGKEHTAATSYGWIDKDKGTVRIPLEQAIALTIQERKTKK
jgi:hypothetical protein